VASAGDCIVVEQPAAEPAPAGGLCELEQLKPSQLRRRALAADATREQM
jgi:hypothetical protein